jgi:hypothetical protein
MQGLGILTDDTGLTLPSAWDAWFRPSAPKPIPRYPKTDVAPGATDAAGMAKTAHDTNFFSNPREFGSLDYTPPATPTVQTNGTPSTAPLRSPVDYVSEAQANNERWFSAMGIARPRPGIGAPTRSGDSFASRYGTGSVRSAGLHADTLRKLTMLGIDDPFDFGGF